MKRLKLSLALAISLMAVGQHVEACGPWFYSPSDYNLYRLLPYDYRPAQTGNFVERNIVRWCHEVGLPVRDSGEVRRAIYEGSLREWEWASLHPEADELSDFAKNRFVRRLLKRRDREALTLLRLSKEYECIRNLQRSPWYYNSRVADERMQLRAIADSICLHAGSRYADRFAFLAIKCAWASCCDSTVLELWQQNRKRLEGSVLRDEAVDYVARSLRRMGRDAEADEIYRKTGRAHQVVVPGTPLPDALRTLLRVDPSSHYLAYWLQQALFVLENNPYSLSDRTLSEYYNHEAVLRVAREAIADPRVGQKAMWRYAAACILDYEGHPAEALLVLDSISADDGYGHVPQFLRCSVRVLRFSLHSRLDSVDDRFERYVLDELRWMDAQLVHEWNRLPDRDRRAVAGSSCPYDVRRHCYLHDAMNRIVLSDSVGVASRLSASGRNVRALQVANMADNRLIGLSSNRVVERLRSSTDSVYGCSYWTAQGLYKYTTLLRQSDTALLDGHDFMMLYASRFNEHDYSNPLFLLADRMDAATLADYCRRVLRPLDGTDRWLNARGYTNGDYWLDIVGTHYLRERNYTAAADHLKRVSPSYQRRMNVRCTLDPFGIDRTATSHDSTHYKLHFALRMAELQRTLLSDFEPDRRGLAMLEYAIGLENSFGNCWYLTSYGRSDWQSISDEWDGMDGYPVSTLTIAGLTYANEAQCLARFLRGLALCSLRTDEARARYYARLGQVATVMRCYSSSSTACHYALVCDVWRDHLCLNTDSVRHQTVRLASLDFVHLQHTCSAPLQNW